MTLELVTFINEINARSEAISFFFVSAGLRDNTNYGFFYRSMFAPK